LIITTHCFPLLSFTNSPSFWFVFNLMNQIESKNLTNQISPRKYLLSELPSFGFIFTVFPFSFTVFFLLHYILSFLPTSSIFPFRPVPIGPGLGVQFLPPIWFGDGGGGGCMEEGAGTEMLKSALDPPRCHA